MELSEVLKRADAGDVEARGKVIQAAYDDLRRLAAGQMAGQPHVNKFVFHS